MPNDLDTLIIGASAAGLATAACVQQARRRFEILEAADVVGQAWRHHYDRLHLHTPRSGSALPGLAMPADWPRHPSRDQVVDYLERYRAHFGLEPRFGQRVTRLERRDGRWIATTADGEWAARAVVIATGANRRPVRPTWPGLDMFAGRVLHSGEYRKVGLRKLPYGPNTQIARDRRIPLLDSGTMAHLRTGRIRAHPGIARFTPDGVVFDDGEAVSFDAVVLATGYRPGLEEFLVPWREVCDAVGRPLVSGRRTALPGLYFCGQFVSPSGMLREIGIEARRFAADLAAAPVEGAPH